MKILSLQSILQAAIFAFVYAPAGSAQDKGTAKFSQRELQAKIVYCKTCHGLSGQGYRGPCPDLRDSNLSTLRISCAPLLSGGGRTP
jgi:hypothetical protein